MKYTDILLYIDRRRYETLLFNNFLSLNSTLTHTATHSKQTLKTFRPSYKVLGLSSCA